MLDIHGMMAAAASEMRERCLACLPAGSDLCVAVESITRPCGGQHRADGEA